MNRAAFFNSFYMLRSQNDIALLIQPSAIVPSPSPKPCDNPSKISISASVPLAFILLIRFCIVRYEAIPSFVPTQLYVAGSWPVTSDSPVYCMITAEGLGYAFSPKDSVPYEPKYAAILAPALPPQSD